MKHFATPLARGLLAALWLVAAPVGASDDDYFLLGVAYVAPDRARSADDGAAGSAGLGLGFSDHLLGEARLFGAVLPADTAGAASQSQIGLGLDVLLVPGGASGRWFLLAGGGGVRNDVGDAALDDEGAFGNVGVGWRSTLRHGARYRIEARAVADRYGPGMTDALLGFVIELAPHAPAPPAAAPAPAQVVTLARPVPVVITDADGDGIDDADDRCANTLRGARVEPDGCVWQEQVVTMSNLRFPLNSERLTPDIRSRLDEVARFFQNQPDVRMDVYGHTDASGSEAHNLKLSKARAASVRNYLVSKGIAAKQLTSDGFGESRPIATNDTEDGRTANRRVDLHIHARQPG